MRGKRAAGLMLLFGAILVGISAGSPGVAKEHAQPDLDLVGVVPVGAGITGSELSHPYLYVTTTSELLIYDVTEPLDPQRISSGASYHLIHGELIPTNDRILLLNDFLGPQSLDIWDVENKSNPSAVATITGLPDEHFGCLLDCRWAYGSEGSVLDLRRPAKPRVASLDWKEALDIRIGFHRLDEFKPGFMVTASIRSGPIVVDARKPLQPRVAGATPSRRERDPLLYSDWPDEGHSRYLVSSVERFLQHGDCGENASTLVTYDTRGWPKDRTFERAGRFEIEGSCAAYYFSFNPDYEETGVLALPHDISGTRIVRIDERGKITELTSFVPPTPQVWHSFWIDDEILYVVNRTGEIYILRYSD